MTRRAFPHSPRRLLAVLLCALAAGCTSSEPTDAGTSTVTLSIDAEATAADAAASRRSSFSVAPGDPAVSALGFSFADVASIRVDVKETATSAAIYINFDLVRSSTGWTGTLPNLPKGKMLTFAARATNASNTLLFSGSTDQTLVTDDESVVISLVPFNDGATITLPRIRRISIPSEFAFNQAGNVSFFVEGKSGEQLRYTLTPADGGGSFLPSSGTLTLSGTAGTFVSRYAPPVTVSAPTEFTHVVRITNEAGHAVSTTFKTKVLPPDLAGDAAGTTLLVQFNPVINTLFASREEGTGNVTWQAEVVDDGPAGQLAYKWSLAPSTTVSPAPAFITQTNPTTLQNYSDALAGVLTLEVTDGNGGKTTLKYALAANQFPQAPADTSGSTAVKSLVGGGSHTCALLNNGSVRCWGYNQFGQLGYGHPNPIGDTELPYTAGAVPLIDPAVQVVAGLEHTCALLSSGQVRCWGRNQYGQLGYGHTNPIGDTEAVTSQSYVNLGSRAVRLAAGGYHTCALLSSGRVRCWGYNYYGQLGYGHTQPLGDDESPLDVPDVQVGGTVQDLVAGGYHTCALMGTGKVRCWGWGNYGQLGYGKTDTIGDTEYPSTAGDVQVGGTVLQLTAGTFHTCALLDSGGVRCWGYNGSGQLGLGYALTSHVGDGETPASVPAVDLGDRALQVSAGDSHTCALLSSGIIKCWGYNVHGQLGYGNATQRTAPLSTGVDLSGASGYFLATGGHHTCALLSTGKARCWGLGNSGQLGYGNTDSIGDTEPPSTAGNILLLAP